jgi:hypothetical protein
MTDWYEMIDSIQRAMGAIEKAHSVTLELKDKADAASVKKFHDEMITLMHHLEQMQQILAHNDTYSFDELAEAFSRTMGNDHSYHRIEPYDTN